MALQDEVTPPAASVTDRMASFFGSQSAETPEAPATEAAPVEAEDTSEEQVAEAVPEEGGEEQPDQQVAEQPADTLVEVEFEGKVRKVDPEIKDALMRQADYTRKTMAHADQVRLFQQQQQAAALQTAFQEESAPDTQQLAKLEGQIDQFKALNWSEMDTDQIVRARQALDAIKEQRDDVKAKLQKDNEAFLKKHAEARAQLLQQGAEYLKKAVPNWGTAAQQDAAQAALAAGFTRDEVAQFTDPRAVQLAWQAAQWTKLQASKPSVAQKVKTAPPMAKPGSAATTDNASTKQYVQIRQDLKKTGSDKAAMAAILNRMGK